jgi:hypothetical protein
MIAHVHRLETGVLGGDDIIQKLVGLILLRSGLPP